MDDFEKELKESFLEEASQLLADAEQCFLALETAANDPSIIEKIFRLAHNFKGSANAVGFSDVGAFAHTFESLLLKMKNQEIPIVTETISLLLKCNDHLCMSIVKLKEDLEARIDSTELTGELKGYLEGKTVVVAAASENLDDEPAPAAEEEPPPDASLFVETAEPVEAAETAETAEADVAATTPVSEPVSVQEPLVSSIPTAKVTKEVSAETSSPTSPTASVQKSGPAAQTDESIRVSLSKVDSLINNVGEVVILQTVLNQQRLLIQSPLIQKTIAQLAKITKDLQELSMGLRMLPLKQTFQKMQRIVRDVAKSLNKDVIFSIQGEDTEIDKTILEQIGDPLVHLIRNAADHGVETTEERLAIGKSPQSHINLRAYQRGEHIVLEVSDDGKGLDPERLRKRAVEKGIISATAKLSERDCFALIFAPGFSTKTEVTDVSGRGVGMDVVKTNVEALKGEIQIDTVLGKGTTFRVLLPLTLAIIDGVVVTNSTDRIVVPLSNIYESVQPAKEDVHHLTGVGDVFCLRGENLPLYRLSGLMGQKAQAGAQKEPWDSLALVVRDTRKPCAILVDDIVGQQQVVIKRLGPELRNTKGLAGGAILGDGRAALIVDLHALIETDSKINRKAA